MTVEMPFVFGKGPAAPEQKEPVLMNPRCPSVDFDYRPLPNTMSLGEDFG